MILDRRSHVEVEGERDQQMVAAKAVDVAEHPQAGRRLFRGMQEDSMSEVGRANLGQEQTGVAKHSDCGRKRLSEVGQASIALAEAAFQGFAHPEVAENIWMQREGQRVHSSPTWNHKDPDAQAAVGGTEPEVHCLVKEGLPWQ